MRKLGPGAAEARHIFGCVDFVAERDCRGSANTQEVARRKRADDVPAAIDDAEMPDAEPAHTPDGAVHERIGRHGFERTAGKRLDRLRKRRAALPRQARA